MSRSRIVLIFGTLGILISIIDASIFYKLLGNDHEFIFDKKSVVVKNKKLTLNFDYNELQSIIIQDNSDYSRIIITTKNGKIYKYFIGITNLLKQKNILEHPYLLDKMLKNYFIKDFKTIKGIQFITFNAKK